MDRHRRLAPAGRCGRARIHAAEPGCAGIHLARQLRGADRLSCRDHRRDDIAAVGVVRARSRRSRAGRRTPHRLGSGRRRGDRAAHGGIVAIAERASRFPPGRAGLGVLCGFGSGGGDAIGARRHRHAGSPAHRRSCRRRRRCDVSLPCRQRDGSHHPSQSRRTHPLRQPRGLYHAGLHAAGPAGCCAIGACPQWRSQGHPIRLCGGQLFRTFGDGRSALQAQRRLISLDRDTLPSGGAGEWRGVRHRRGDARYLRTQGA